MLDNLLLKIDGALVGDSALYALLGFAITFLGIALLIFIVWLVGLLMPKGESAVEKAQEKKKAKKEKKEVLKRVETVSDSCLTMESDLAAMQADANVAKHANDLDEETVAVITAAIMAYYQKTNPKCEFTVKRIKRI